MATEDGRTIVDETRRDSGVIIDRIKGQVRKRGLIEERVAKGLVSLNGLDTSSKVRLVVIFQSGIDNARKKRDIPLIPFVLGYIPPSVAKAEGRIG